MKLGPLTELALAAEAMIPQDRSQKDDLDALCNRGLAERSFRSGHLAYRISVYGKMHLRATLQKLEDVATP